MSDYIALSNTGKTITVSMSAEFYERWAPYAVRDVDGRVRVRVEYERSTDRVHITPDPKGRRIGTHAGHNGRYVGMQSKADPYWPQHGKVVFDEPEFNAQGRIVLFLPKPLPAPKVRHVQKSRSHDTRTDYSHAGPMRDVTTTLEDREALTVPATAPAEHQEPAPVAPAPICHYGLWKVPAYQWDTVKTVMEALGCTLADKISAL